MNELNELRIKLADIDKELLTLLFQRNKLVDQVKVYKQDTKLPVYQANVQAKKLEQAKDLLLSLDTSISKDELQSLQLVLRLIMDMSVSRQLGDRQVLRELEEFLSEFEKSATGKLAASFK